MKSKIYSLVVIILLLVIFLPLTVFGYIYKQNHKVEENPNHEMYYKGSIWFYDEDDNYLSKYICQTEICELAKPTIDDDNYELNYYKDGTIESILPISNKYAFIRDGDYINLYEFNINKTIQNYLAIKTYNIKLSDDIYVLQNKDNMWGVLYVKENINVILPFEYNYIGIKNDIDKDGILVVKNYVALKDDKWNIINSNGESVIEFDEPIIDYTNRYIFTKNDNIKIYNYSKDLLISNLKIDNYILLDDFVGIVSNNVLYIYNNILSTVYKQVNISNPDGIELKVSDKILYIYEDNILLDTLK